MPAYVVTADIYNVLSTKVVAELTDDSAGATPNNTIIDSALERAESVVDSYVGKVYTVPLTTPVDKSITHAVLTLATCYLHRRRPGAIPDEATDACEKIVVWLEMVAEGNTPLAGGTGVADAADENSSDPLFNDIQVF